MLARVRALLPVAWLVLFCSCDKASPASAPDKPVEQSAAIAEKQAKITTSSGHEGQPAAASPASPPLPATRNDAEPPKDGCVLRHQQALRGNSERALAGSLSGAPVVVALEDA